MSGLNITITDNSGEYIKAKDEAVIRALESIGLHLEGEAADELENDPRHVDTTRLKGSIVYATKESSGAVRSPATAADGAPRETPEKGAVYVGTNVEYAAYVIRAFTKVQAAWTRTASSKTLLSEILTK